MTIIDANTLIYGMPSWHEVVDFFKNGSFDNEQYLVAAIGRHLMNEDHRQAISGLRLTVEDILNVRYTEDQEVYVYRIYRDWNDKLGFTYFGH